jgi:hypothetical protein
MWVAFSCGGRGFCPSGGGRRMNDTAAHLVDRVISDVPVRQWVRSLPHRPRYLCAKDPGLLRALLRIFLRAVFRLLRRLARRRGVRKGQCGSANNAAWMNRSPPRCPRCGSASALSQWKVALPPAGTAARRLDRNAAGARSRPSVGAGRASGKRTNAPVTHRELLARGPRSRPRTRGRRDTTSMPMFASAKETGPGWSGSADTSCFRCTRVAPCTPTTVKGSRGSAPTPCVRRWRRAASLSPTMDGCSTG